MVLLAGGSASAKSKIAILGLEVQGTSSVDSDSTRVATDLTVALRTRPKAGQGPYAWTPGSEKELVDEKIMNNCPTEDKDCMAKIGAALGADFLIYGRIERKSVSGQAGYQVWLKLLKVGDGKPGSAQQLPGWTEFIPLSESNNIKLQEWARKGYKKLTNDFDGGNLKVRIANEGFDRGTILIDGTERGNIISGQGEVQSLPEGRYTLSIVAGGFERWDSGEKITIRNGETTTEDVTMKRASDLKPCDPLVSNDCGGTVSQDSGGRGKWRAMMVAGAVLGVVGGGTWIFGYTKVEDANKCKETEGPCGPFENGDQRDKQGERGQLLSYIGGTAVGVGATLLVIGLVKGYITGGSAERVSTRSKRGKTELVVAPVVTDRSAGATLQLRW